jgi:hypothetical protein
MLLCGDERNGGSLGGLRIKPDPDAYRRRRCRRSDQSSADYCVAAGAQAFVLSPDHPERDRVVERMR